MRLNFPWIFAFCAALLFGLSNPLGKIAVSKMNPFVYAAVAVSFAALLALVWMLLKGTHFTVGTKDWPNVLGIGLVSLAIPTFLTGYAFSLSSSISVGLLLRMEAFFAVLYGAFLFKERLSRIQLFGIVLGLVGALAFATDLTLDFGFAEGIVMVASALYGTFLVFVKRLPDVGPVELTAVRSLVAAIPLWFFAFPLISGFSGWPEAMGLSLFSFFLGPLAYAASVKEYGLWRTGAVAQFFSAIFSVLAGVVWLNESFTSIQWVSAAIILAGGILIVLKSEETETPSSPVLKARKIPIRR